MDTQVLNEIANQARQASLAQARVLASANPQLKALKGNPASPVFEDSPVPEQTQDPVTPDISSVARAASVYSAVVGDGLNLDELNAIQNLSEKVRTAVSEFLSQPGLEQASNVAAVVASNPEAVQDLISSVDRAVGETLSAESVVDETTASASPASADLSEEKFALENLVSVERITHGAEPNRPVVAQKLEAVNLPANENTQVVSPEVSESSRGDFRVAVTRPTLQNVPVSENVSEVEVSSNRPVTPVSPTLPDTPVPENMPVETPVNTSSQEVANRLEVAAVPQERRPDTDSTSPQEEVPVAVVNPTLRNAPATENVPESETSSNRLVTPVGSSLQNESVPENNSAATPVSRLEVAAIAQERRLDTVATNPQEEALVTSASSTLPSVPVAENVPVNTNSPIAVPVTSAVPQESKENIAPIVNSEGAVVLPEGESTQAASKEPKLQPGPQSAPVQVNDLFAQGSETVNPENIRNANALVNSVVDNEFTSEAKKIFSEPKVIRTVADLADFILERLREIIAANQQQSSSDNEIGIS